jgi:hypothetical protein
MIVKDSVEMDVMDRESLGSGRGGRGHNSSV